MGLALQTGPGTNSLGYEVSCSFTAVAGVVGHRKYSYINEFYQAKFIIL